MNADEIIAEAFKLDRDGIDHVISVLSFYVQDMDQAELEEVIHHAELSEYIRS